ncbi:MAG TPA: hypothetical protein VEK08_18460 [Planctomycetota bacterium]|nr:hypothetical protein [Planctomycetota bacterium]
MPPLVVSNEPVAPLSSVRSPRIWQTMLDVDLPGKMIKSQIQLNHNLTEEEKPLLDDRILKMYAAVTRQFGKLHGESTKCFLVRAPESLDLVGIHILPFGGATNSIACYETVFCVSPRTDSKIVLSHIDSRFAPAEYDLFDGLPKTRVPFWPEFAEKNRGNRWSDVIHGALKQYVNSHKGPTGQIELTIPGMNIVVGAVLPEGLATHSDSTLSAAALASVMALTGEWGKVSLAEFEGRCAEAQEWGSGRRSNLGAVLFGMPGEVVHVDWSPPRAKGRMLPHSICFVTAHTGTEAPPAELEAAREMAAGIGQLLFRQEAVARLSQEGHATDALMSAETVYEVLEQVPETLSRAQALEALKAETVKSRLQDYFKTHAEPAGGYRVREKLLYLLAEMQRAMRAQEAIRAADATELGALMNIGQVGEATLFHELSPSGIIEKVHRIVHPGNDDELASLTEQAAPLWKQSGFWGSSTPETDLLCDLAQGVPGVLGARLSEPCRIVAICTHAALVPLLERLTSGYYIPRGLPSTLAGQVFACRGIGIVDG